MAMTDHRPPAATPAPARRPSSRTATRRLAAAPAPRPELGHPILTANATLAAGSVAHLFAADIPWWMFPAGGTIAAFTAATTTMARLDDSVADGLFAGAVGAGAGGWLAWTAATTPWAPAQLFALAAGSMVLGPAYGLLRWRRTSRARKELEARQKRRAEAKATSWSRILSKAGVKDVTIAATRPFDGGFSLDLLLSGQRSPDFSGLAAALPSIERVAAHVTGLPIRPGTIQCLRGELAHQATLVVPTQDVIGQTIELPDLEGAATVHEPFSVGQYVGEGEIMVHWRRIHALFVGMNDSGKTEFLHTHIARLTRCTDNVIWLVAGNKSVPLMAPWMLPFVRGEVDRPPFDWPANGIDEGLKVLLDAYRAVDTRQGMYREGAAEFIPTDDQPQITVMVEEAPDLLNSRKRVQAHDGETYTFSELVLKLLRTGRSEGVGVILLSQRGTSTMLGEEGGDLKSQVAYRAGLRIKGNFVDVDSIFTGDTTGVQLQSLPNGAVYVEHGADDRPRLGKGYLTTAEHKRRLAVRHAAYCGGIDPQTAATLTHYAERWQRPATRALLEQIAGGRLPAAVGARIGPPAEGGGQMTQPDSGAEPDDMGGGWDSIGFQPSAHWDDAIERREAAERIEHDAQNEPSPFDGEFSAEALAELFGQPARDDAERNAGAARPTAPTPAGPSATARELLAAVLGSDLMYSMETTIPTADVLAVAADELGWPDNPEGSRRVTAALREVGIETRRTTVAGSRTMVVDGEPLREAARQWGAAGS